KLAEMLGWARRMARAEWRKSPRGRAEMVGYKAHDLRPETMASVEWGGLLSGDEALEMDWTRRAVDGGVRHRHYEGEERQGRGPLVLVRDESGSMVGAPHSLAVALEWALLEIARRDRREFYSVPFSGTGQYHVWKAPSPAEPDPGSLLSHLSHFYGGGTEPYAPLAQALELIQSHNLRADILMITDDDFAEPPAEFLERLAEAKRRCPLRVVVVVVGADDAQARAFADKVTTVSDLVHDREQLRGAVAGVV
ncbi:MAG: VWA domain-containing protein, partial [Thermoflexales bacterium]|nr:VWA domain-containing protein [Thermoflexales bacterium]